MSALQRKRYRVTLVTTVSYRGTVEAASEDEAEDLAEELWCGSERRKAVCDK